MSGKLTGKAKKLAAALVVLAIGWVAQQAGFDLDALGGGGGGSRAGAPIESVPSNRAGGADSSAGVQRIEAAAAVRESGFMVTVEARVAKNLPDDLEGSRHQRFLVELDSGRTLLVAHNIDLADRIALRENARVRLRGQYEWNEKGGVLHWTHHDPAGRHPGGWIEFEGQRVE